VRSLRSCGLVSILSIGFTSVALAQEASPSASDIALARSLGSEGVQLADAGNCAAAVEKLQRAEALYHAPTMLVRLGECQVALGKVVAGTENLQRVVREALPPKAPKAFVDAQARAQRVLASALPKVARLKIHVDAPPGVRPSVKLDGDSIPLAALDVDRPADPGVHQIEVSAPGFLTARQDATLQEGSTGSATLKLEPELAPAGPAPMGPGGAPAAPAMPGQYGPPAGSFAPMPGPSMGGTMSPPGQETTGGSSQKTVGFVLIGVGAAGAVVGSVFGGIAMAKKTSLDDACKAGKDRCPPQAQSDIDSLKTSATVSTVGFAIGGVGLVSGLIVLLTAKPSSTGETGAQPLRASVTPLIGPSSLGLAGSF
jgi:hypothetical protein